jgi:hypothetical protein
MSTGIIKTHDDPDEPEGPSYEFVRDDVTGHITINPPRNEIKSIVDWIYPQRYIAEEQNAIATIQKSEPTDFQAISASKLTLSNSFYNNTLRQSQQSFLWSLIWAGVGSLFIIITVILVIVLQPTIATSVIIALLGGTGGVGSSAIAYATLQLYKQASEQAAACHIRLDRSTDFILANSACEGLEGPEKKVMRSEIIRKLFE